MKTTSRELSRRLHARLFLPVMGFFALLWVIVRLLEKPSRAQYPCIQAAAPIATTFVLYVTGLFGSLLFYKRALRYFADARYLLFIFTLGAGLTLGLMSYVQSDYAALAGVQSTLEGANQPMGVGRGLFPGRVVWIHHPQVVDQSCTNGTGDYWWQDDNTRQSAVDSMVSRALQLLTGKTSDTEAWDALFRYHNRTHGKGDVGYTAGEKIVIKLNLNTGASGTSYTRADNRTVDTSPQIVCAMLGQLTQHAGVAQTDIGFGDPGRNVDGIFWNKFHALYPDVKYWGNGNGRTPIVKSSTPQLMTSDGTMQNDLPTCYLEASYMINIPVLKQHHRAGISLTSKNHFGDFVPFLGNAFPLHYSLPCTNGDKVIDNGGYGKYRIFVDFIGHKDLGGKTVLYLVDGLWSSTNWGDPPWKWRMAPFNTHYPASIFASQDPVAIESVGFDFLYNEFPAGNPSGNDFPRYSGVDDFLHQAADSVNWAAGIIYDPEHDSIPLPRSMGVHEHWNNATDKAYTRNLHTGEGIELLGADITTGVNQSAPSLDLPVSSLLLTNFPNPFNPITSIQYTIGGVRLQASGVRVIVLDLLGREVAVLVDATRGPGDYTTEWDAKGMPSGIYLCRLQTGNASVTRKMILEK